MRFLANENFPVPSVRTLRETGIEVKSISENSPGISDKEVIQIAQKEKLIILTFDKDYGELIFRHSIQFPQQLFSSGLRGRLLLLPAIY